MNIIAFGIMHHRHLLIEADALLLANIRQRVKSDLITNQRLFSLTLIIKFIICISACACFYSLLFLDINEGYFMTSYVFLGLSLLLLAFNFAHDLSHDTVFKNKEWNNLGFIAIYSLLGAHAEAWRERHVTSHHFAPNVQEYDSDLQMTNLIRVTPHMPCQWFHRFQVIYAPVAYSFYSLYWIFIKDVKFLFRRMNRPETGIQYLLSFCLQKLFYLIYLLILPLLFSGHSFAIVLTGFVLMHLVQSLFLLLTFFMTHHVLETAYPDTDQNGMIQTSWLMNQIRSSNDMHPFSRVANFILGGFNNHVAHHLFPRIHHIHYPNLSKILYQTLAENGITPNKTSYWGGVLSHMKLLKKLSV
jgi:linoleoyl-CoA desaturase